MATRKSWRAIPPKGWIPVEVRFENEPFYVGWRNLQSRLLEEPFFRQTIDRLRKEPDRALTIRTDIETLLAAGEGTETSIEPAGVIFHLSRCGSTLITNYLKAVTNAVVLSEADPFLDLLTLCVFEVDCARAARAGQLLKAAANVFSYYRSPIAEPLVLKLSPLNSFCLVRARELWPTARFAIVVRDPVAIVKSNATKRARWLQRRQWRAGFFPWAPISPHQMHDIEFCSRALGDFCGALLRGIDDKCMIIDYSQIDAKTMSEVAQWFGLNIRDDSDESIRAVMSKYSKAVSSTEWCPRPKQPDDILDAMVDSGTQRWAMEPYNQLLKKRREIRCETQSSCGSRF